MKGRSTRLSYGTNRMEFLFRFSHLIGTDRFACTVRDGGERIGRNPLRSTPTEERERERSEFIMIPK